MVFNSQNVIGSLLANVIEILIILIVIDAVVSNLIAFGNRVSSRHPAVIMLRKIVNPLCEPVRKILPPRSTGGWDLSPMIVIVVLQLIRNMLYLH